MPIYKQTTEITNIDDLLSSVERDIEEVYFGDKQVFTVWAEYDGTLPAQYSSNGSTLADYRIYGASGGVGDDSGTAYGYEVDMSVASNNLIDCEGVWTPYYAPTANSTGDNQTGDLTLTGRYYFYKCIKIKPNTTYTFSSRCSSYDMQRGYTCVGAHNGIPDTTDTIFSRFVSDYDTSFNTGNHDEIAIYLYSGAATEGTSVYTTLQLSEGNINNFIPYSKTTTPIYIGSDPLGEDEYVDYGEGKIYRMSGGVLTPTDPPVPLPALPTVDGVNIVNYVGQSAAVPERFTAKYRKEGF